MRWALFPHVHIPESLDPASTSNGYNNVPSKTAAYLSLTKAISLKPLGSSSIHTPVTVRRNPEE